MTYDMIAYAAAMKSRIAAHFRREAEKAKEAEKIRDEVDATNAAYVAQMNIQEPEVFCPPSQ
jgi:hypothetical protein